MFDLSKIKNNILFVNITSQGVVQLANYLIPLLLIPFVTRVLGADAFGKASYAQNIGVYFTLLVNYGFDYSATQVVALNKDNHAKLQSVFSTVIAFKSLLLVISFALLAVLYLTMPRVQNDFYSFFLVAAFNLGWVLFPTWFFQGVERMAKMSMFSFLVKSLGAVFVVLSVSSPEHYHRYLLGLTLANIVVGFFSFFYVKRTYHFQLEKPQPFLSDESVRKGFPIFLNTILINCNSVLGMFLMGFYVSDFQIGIYSGTQKIIMAIMMVSYQPIMIALFPRVSRHFNESKAEGFKFFKKCLSCIAVYSLLVSVVTYLAAPLAVKICLGDKFADAVPFLRLLAVYPFLASMASTLTVHGLYGLQLQRFAPVIGLAVCICSISLNFLLVPSLQTRGAIYSWLVCELVEISVAAGLLVWKKKVND